MKTRSLVMIPSPDNSDNHADFCAEFLGNHRYELTLHIIATHWKATDIKFEIFTDLKTRACLFYKWIPWLLVLLRRISSHGINLVFQDSLSPASGGLRVKWHDWLVSHLYMNYNCAKIYFDTLTYLNTFSNTYQIVFEFHKNDPFYPTFFQKLPTGRPKIQ